MPERRHVQKKRLGELGFAGGKAPSTSGVKDVVKKLTQAEESEVEGGARVDQPQHDVPLPGRFDDSVQMVMGQPKVVIRPTRSQALLP